MYERIFHHGVPIDDLSDSLALAQIAQLIGSSNATNQIVTLTVEMYNAARANPDFARVLNQSALVLPESTGLALYSSIFPPKFGKISGGVYLARKLVGWCSENDKKVVLFGSSDSNRSKARDRLRARFNYPKIHTVEGDYQFSNSTDSSYVASQLDVMQPDFCIMAGNEVLAEQWINKWLVQSDVFAGVVGNFGMTIDRESEQRWVPNSTLHKLGVSWLLLYPSRKPERRGKYARGLLELALNGLQDLQSAGVQRRKF